MQTKLINAEEELGHRPRTWRIQSSAVPVRCTFVMGVSRYHTRRNVGLEAQPVSRLSEEIQGVIGAVEPATYRDFFCSIAMSTIPRYSEDCHGHSTSLGKE